MGIRDTVRQQIAELIVERPGRKRTLDAWATELERSGAVVDGRAVRAGDSAAARRVLRHVIGIEQWGQNRLRVFLGAPLIVDEYDGYCPDEALAASALRTIMQSTRAETILLARALAQAEVDPTATVLHNQLGPLTARGWLAYLNDHGKRETLLLR